MYCLRGGLSLEFLDSDIAPLNSERTGFFSDAVDLQSNHSFRVSLVYCLIGKVGNRLTIDPGLDARSLGNNAVFVPLAVFEMLVWFELGLWSESTAACSFTVNISSLGAFCTACFNLDLRTVDSSSIFTFGILEQRPDLNTGVEPIVTHNFKLKFKVAVMLLGAEKGIAAAFGGGS